MKKLAAAIFISSAFVAGSAEAAWQSNFLVGVSAGYINQDGHFDFSLNRNDLGLLQSGSAALDHDSFLWGVLGGWQVRCNNMLYGLEIYVDWQNSENSNLQRGIPPTALTPGGTIYADYENEVAAGFTGRVGYSLTPYIMPYVRAGAEASSQELDTTVSLIGSPDPFANQTNRKTNWRFLVGIGVELPFPLLDGASFRAEYNYHSRAQAVEGSGTGIDGVTSVVASGSQVAHSGKASLVYNFL